MGFYHRVMERATSTRAGGWAMLHVVSPIDKRLMRWTKGAVNSALGTDFRDNGVLLRSTGAKSGKPRDVPLLAIPFEGGWVLIASAAGIPNNPAWYHNLKAHPRCALIVPHRGEVACVAHEAVGAERERAWQAATDVSSGFTVYQERTQRQIPVMVLRPES